MVENKGLRMKQVLIIDESPLFREYLRLKLAESDIQVHVGVNALDGAAKIRSLNPDLLIMDYHLSRQGCMEVLRAKRLDPNTMGIPVIVMAQWIDQKKILELVLYNVKKVFTKPIKIDALFITLSEILRVPFSVDESPGLVEVHVNDDIIFVEIAQGLNRDKLDLLRFKITELIEVYEIKIPKVIVMLSDIHLGFADAPNLQKLLEVLMPASRTGRRYIRVLTHDTFIRQYIESRKEYGEIVVVSNLQYAMDGLLSELDKTMEYAEKKAEIIGDRILSAGPEAEEGVMQLRFEAESKPKKMNMDALRDSMRNLRIAVVDDDFIVRELIKHTFRETGANVSAFASGKEYLAVVEKTRFDLVFLDLVMPIMDGFSVLTSLRFRDIQQPVIVLSAVTQRETIMRAFRMGVKSYLTKPLKPDAIFKKAVEILKPDF
jgi:CheY-like chemotaxis protein